MISKNTSEYEQKVHNCINVLTTLIIIFLQNMGTWKIEITELFQLLFFQPIFLLESVANFLIWEFFFFQLIYVIKGTTSGEWLNTEETKDLGSP